MAEIDQLYQMLNAADAAGNREDVAEIMGMISEVQSGQAEADRMAQIQADQQAELARRAEEMGVGETMLVGAGKAFSDIGRGAQSLYAKATDDEEMLNRLRGEEAEAERLYSPLREASPWATLGGEMLPALATIPLGGTGLIRAGGQAGARALQAGGGMLQAARAAAPKMAQGLGIEGLLGAGTSGLMAPIDQQEEAAGWGGLLSMAMPGVSEGISRLGGAAGRQLSRLAEAQGVKMPLSPGQMLGSDWMTKAEETIRSIPGVGAAFESLSRGQQKAVNRLANEAIGESGDEVTGATIEAARKNIGNRFQRAIGTDQAFDYDAGFIKGVRDLRRSYQEGLFPGTDKMKIATERLLSRIKRGEKMTPSMYQEFSSQISAQLRSGALEGTEKTALANMKTALDDMIERQLGGDNLQMFRDARKQWKALRDVEKVVDVEAGDISAKKLANRLERQDPARFGTGQDPLDVAGRLGRRYSRSIGDSGTASRMMPWMMAGGLGYGASQDPTATGLTGAAALMAPWLYRGGGSRMAPLLLRGAQGAGATLGTDLGSQAMARTGAGLVPGLLEE